MILNSSTAAVPTTESKMTDDHTKIIERHVGDLRKIIDDLAAPAPFEELLRIIHRPGWTTLAEVALVNLNLETLTATTRMLVRVKGDLIKAAGQVKAG
jgi:hypothetical protein